MAKKEETQDQSIEDNDKSAEEQDLTVLHDVEKFKEASREDQEAYMVKLQAGEFDPVDEDKETSKESDEESEDEEEEEKTSDKDEPTEDGDSQSDSDEEDKDNEKEEKDSASSEKRLSKLEKSYKSLEAEFTRRSQKLARQDDELDKRDSRIKELESELKRQKGQVDKNSILDKVKEKNPDAALLLSQIKEEAVLEAKQQFEEELKSLKSQFGEGKEKENQAVFQSALDEFMESPLAALEPELLEIINSEFADEEALAKAASNDPKLFNKLRKELLDRHFDKAAKLSTKKSQSKPDNKKRDKEIQSGKGAGKSKVSTKKDADDPDSIEYFNKLPKDKQVEYLKKRGLYR